MYTNDVFGIQNTEGTSSVLTLNIIIDALLKQTVKEGLMIVFNKKSRKIVVLNSSDLDPNILQDLLYKSSLWKYEGPYPIVEEERGKRGNLKIRLSSLKPDQTRCCFRFDCHIDHIDWEAVRHNEKLSEE